MAPTVLGSQGSSSRPILAVDPGTSTPFTPSEHCFPSQTSSSGITTTTARTKRSGTCQRPGVSVSRLRRSQARFRQTTIGTRSQPSEHLYSTSPIPHAHTESSSSRHATRSLAGFFRPRECLLARTNTYSFQKISGGKSRFSSAPVYSDALRTQYRPKSLYKINKGSSVPSGSSRDQHYDVPGRLADPGSFARTGITRSSDHNESLQPDGFSVQPTKIPVTTYTDTFLAGSGMDNDKYFLGPVQDKCRLFASSTPLSDDVSHLHSQTMGESYRGVELCSRPDTPRTSSLPTPGDRRQSSVSPAASRQVTQVSYLPVKHLRW